MKTVCDEQFQRECIAFAFRFSCLDCEHFLVDTEACEHGYPTDDHRETPLAMTTFAFCKDFELAE